MSMSEIETVDAGPSKRAKTAASGTTTTLRKQLVACFMQEFPVRYNFRFYSTQELLFPQFGVESFFFYQDLTPILKPERWLLWLPPRQFWRFHWQQNRGSDDHVSVDDQGCSLERNPYALMSFLHSSKLDDDALYVVGGIKPSGVHDLPNEFARIPLSGKDEVHVKAEPQLPMKKGKLYPLIVEIGGCIFVLSMDPFPIESPESAFEVYNPEETSGWKSIPAPPFIGARDYCSPRNMIDRYSYLVVDDRKLFVSDGICSCVFDTETWAWEKCDLFSKCFPNMKLPYLEHAPDLACLDGCGPGFPFQNQAILWKDDIFLCLIPGRYPPIAAFNVSKSRDKAVQIQLCFGLSDMFMWYGRFDHLVDLGEDYVAVLLYEKECEERFMTILTFKLSKGDNGIVSCVLKGQRRCKGHMYDEPAQFCFAL